MSNPRAHLICDATGYIHRVVQKWYKKYNNMPKFTTRKRLRVVNLLLYGNSEIIMLKLVYFVLLPKLSNKISQGCHFLDHPI